MSRTSAGIAALILLTAVAVAPLTDAMAAGGRGTDATSSPSASPSAGSSSSGGSAAGNATFGLGPATKGKVDRRNNFNYLQAQGSVVSDQVAIVNLGTTPLTLNIYAADAINDADGSLGLQPGRVKPADSASWVMISTPNNKGYVVVPARTAAGPSTVIVPFTVRVPKNAGVGDHLAGVVTSLVTQGSTPGDRSANVKLEQRIAVRLATRVAGELKAQLTIDDVRASYVGALNPLGRGTATVTYVVHNTGNVRLGGKPSISVHGLFGPSTTPEALPDVPLLLPGSTATITVDVPDVTPLIYLSADVSVVALAAVGDANPASQTPTRSARFWAVPWTLIAVLLLLAGLAALWWRRWRVLAAGPIEAARGAELTPNPPVGVTTAPNAQQEN